MIKDWKLKLRYGKSNTSYKHFTLIAPGIINQYIEEFDAQPGTAYLSMKIWATNDDESADVFQNVSEQIGFQISGNMDIYDTAPEVPPGEVASAYDINFSYYTDED